jgi:uncharacterized MAPEG superfamily protein
MILVILLVLALFVIQTLLPNRFREPAAESSVKVALGPRDDPRPYTVIGGRAARALSNMQEALPVFLALALLNLIVGSAAEISITGAWIFLLARVVYVPAYLSGIPGLRTLVWAVGLVGLALMVAPLLDRI